jgi:predicted RNA binding protein YcfA (HicA-like mRNA interferase family)
MSRAKKAADRVLSAEGDVSFRDFDAVARQLGFVLDRISGSHHIYLHPKVPRPLNIQPIGKYVKRYQLRQFRAIAMECDLLDGTP